MVQDLGTVDLGRLTLAASGCALVAIALQATDLDFDLNKSVTVSMRREQHIESGRIMNQVQRREIMGDFVDS